MSSAAGPELCSWDPTWSLLVLAGFLAHVSVFEPVAVLIRTGVTAGSVLGLCLHLRMT